MEDLFAKDLEALRARSLDRHLREITVAQGPEVEIGARRFINFSSNDYLGLQTILDYARPRLRRSTIWRRRRRLRLISGTQSPHLRLEGALAKWKGTEAALCFSSGYAAALGTIPALVTKNDVVLLDKLCHASLIDGARLSGAILRVFPHNHLAKLASHLEWARREHPAKRVLVITESVFSMDGDHAPLRGLVKLKKRFGALLMLDEAHAIGVIGPNGRGLAAEENVSEEVDVQMGTLSKALGASGGYICGARTLIEWLINRARSFIYSTAPPPAIAAASLAAVDFLASPEGEERRLLLWERIRLMQGLLPRAGLNEEQSGARSAIFPWIVGDEQAALNLAAALQGEGFLVPAIRYPTVAKGAARLRITVTAAHKASQIEALCGTIKRQAVFSENFESRQRIAQDRFQFSVVVSGQSLRSVINAVFKAKCSANSAQSGSVGFTQDHFPCRFRIRHQMAEDDFCRDRFLFHFPAIVIGDHRHCSECDLRFAASFASVDWSSRSRRNRCDD
ncbi:MAG: 8-amino-7-oxononanoate synthase [Candidatus Udaeobacter sp.]|nr:MAG: 8-amino-7-oxononanoate synthase [Candidatus Udaeobacter sp.]